MGGGEVGNVKGNVVAVLSYEYGNPPKASYGVAPPDLSQPRLAGGDLGAVRRECRAGYTYTTSAQVYVYCRLNSTMPLQSVRLYYGRGDS